MTSGTFGGMRARLSAFLLTIFLASCGGGGGGGGSPGVGSGGGLGWSEIPNTQLATICAANTGFPEVQGNSGCPSITLAWSGGAFDTARNRLVLWGGGHSDYAGNEVYALNLDSLTIQRLNDPSTPVQDGCSGNGTYADGRPVSRHTYNHLAYLPVQDSLFAWGGSMYSQGCQGDDAWMFNLSTLTWTEKSSTNGPAGGHFGVSIAYDPVSGLVYGQDDFNLFSYDPTTNAWTQRSTNSPGIGENKTAVVDPVRRRYYFHGNGSTTLFWYDITNPAGTLTRQSGATSGCDGFIGNGVAGMEYDPVRGSIVGWDGGNTVYILNPDTRTCTTQVHPGGPASFAQGTYGRFRYAPAHNVFVVCNRVDLNCHTLRLTP